MVSLADGFLLTGVLAGGGLCWVGYRTYRMPDCLGRRAFVAYAATLGFGTLVTGIVGLAPSPLGIGPEEPVFSQIPLLVWLLSTLPWFVFALQYTGTRTRVRRRTAALLSLPYALVLLQIGLSMLDVEITLLNLLGPVVLIYTISLVAGGAYLLLQSTYAAGHLSLGQGVSLSVAPIGSLTVWNAMVSPSATSATGQAGAYAAGASLAALALGTALRRYEFFESTPSIGTLGREALIGETDDLMFVVDDDGRVIELNETAVETLGVTRPDALGSALSAVLAHGVGELRASETVSLRTTGGTGQYDPQVSTVSDHLGNDLGAVLSLRDVTERKLREQRLAVLNRVLRHNLRNEADVVRGHAEHLDDEGREVDTIIEAADSIAALGRQARRIDRYVSESPEDVSVDLSAVVERALDTVEAGDADVSVSVEIPGSASIVTNERALASALESALDNAITYADSDVSIAVEKRPAECVIRVADDGPGIPEWELDSLDTGTETALQHSTGIGLWQIKWAVMTLNGELSFDTDGGTTVTIVVPDRGGGWATAA